MKTIGILAVQGGYDAHARVLERLGARTREVRRPVDLDAVDGLVLPGGESGVQRALIEQLDLAPALRDLVRAGRPVLATCAGLILASRVITSSRGEDAIDGFGWIDVVVDRNAYGAQNESFEAIADDGKTPLIFIRAPRIVSVGPGARVLLTLRGEPVLVQDENVTGAAFHPELTNDVSIHARVFELTTNNQGTNDAHASIQAG